MHHLRSRQKIQEKQKKALERRKIRIKVNQAILDSSYHDRLNGETVFWQQGIEKIRRSLEVSLGFVPQYAVDLDRCGEVLSVGWRLK